MVSSPLEAAWVRAIATDAGRPDFLIVTPGVRPEGADRGDQQRVATPRAALEAGATHLVVARPVVMADNPLLAASAVVEDIPRRLLQRPHTHTRVEHLHAGLRLELRPEAKEGACSCRVGV